MTSPNEFIDISIMAIYDLIFEHIVYTKKD